MYCKYPFTTLWHLFSTLFLVSLKTFYFWKHCRLAESYFANKGLYSQSYGFSSSLVRMWVLDHKEDWVPKNWCFWIVVLEKTLESLLDSQEIKPVNAKGNQPWTFIGRTDAEAPILCDAMWCEELTHWKRPWCWERLRVGGEGPTKDEKVGWHHWLNGHEFEQTLGDSGGQGSLECCSPWCHKELDMTGQLNNKNNSKILESHVPFSQVPPMVTSYIVGKTRKLTSDHHFYLDHTLYSVSTIFLACVCVCVSGYI